MHESTSRAAAALVFSAVATLALALTATGVGEGAAHQLKLMAMVLGAPLLLASAVRRAARWDRGLPLET